MDLVFVSIKQFFQRRTSAWAWYRKQTVSIHLSCTIFLPCVFFFSSVLKSVNIHSFAYETRLYIDAYMAEWLHPLAMTGAITVCVIEMMLALLAIRKEFGRIIAIGFFLPLSFFVGLTALNLFFPTLMGSIESCGCFGELIHFSPTTSFIKSVVLWIMSLVLVINSYRNHESWNIIQLIRDKYLYICTGVSLVLPLYSLLFFEQLDHTQYLIIYVLLCCMIFISMFPIGEHRWRHGN